jgi:hypothetical protein
MRLTPTHRLHLEKIAEICESEELTKQKIDDIYETVINALGRNKGIPKNQEMLSMAKKIIKKEKLNITRLKLNSLGNFEFLVYFSAGCYGDWTEREVLSPYIFYQRIIKPYLSNPKI